MKIKVSEATNIQLDWLVAKLEGWDYDDIRNAKASDRSKRYSTDWAQGGPILQNHISELIDCAENGWEACCNGTYGATGNTALEAVCKAYVASKLGPEIEIPQELV